MYTLVYEWTMDIRHSPILKFFLISASFHLQSLKMHYYTVWRIRLHFLKMEIYRNGEKFKMHE